jgi:hypothetical protein
MILIATPRVLAQTTTVRFFPQPAPQAVVTDDGQSFTVACVVEDVADLAGLDIQMTWNTTYLAYVSHDITATVEDYPSPIAPSPYAGIIHDPPLWLKDEVNTTAGTYWAAFATLGGPSFDGDGTVFVMTFTSINTPFGNPLDSFLTYLHFTAVDLAAGAGGSISHVREDGEIQHYYKEFEYPAWPKLSVIPEDIVSPGLNVNVTADVILHGINMTYDVGTRTWAPVEPEEITDLHPFWDVAGVDAVMHFDPTLLTAVDVQVDPDGWFAAFWAAGIFVLAADIDNVAGTVYVAFIGLGDPHLAPYGTGRIFSVTFETLTESNTLPVGSCPISLGNDFPGPEKVMHSMGGLIPPSTPVGTLWTELVTNFGDGPMELTGWTDDGSLALSSGDIITMEHTGTGFYFDYDVDHMTGTLELLQQPFATIDNYVWPASFGEDGLANNGLPGRYVGTDDPYNGFGVPYWTGNFSLTYPFVTVDHINCTYMPFTGSEYTATLTEGVDYLVHADDDLVELLLPVDTTIINEMWTDGVDNMLNGWPWINYVASGISEVFVDMHNGTARPSPNLGYYTGPPSEWWYDPDWPWELEGYWALGYYTGSFNWLPGSTWWLNYTAASYLTIDYAAEPDPNPRYLEFRGDYPDFLVALTDPIHTMWDEIVPLSWRDYNCTGWTDSDASTDINPSDYLQFYEYDTGEYRDYHVEARAVDLMLTRKPWICEDDPDDQFFGVAPIVSIAGYPHPERDYCPWDNKGYAVPLPHVVNDAVFYEYFHPLGGYIDIWTQNGGEGPGAPGGLFWPQKEVLLCGRVTYADWPEQNKDVAFQIMDPDGVTWGVFVNRTNEDGYVCVRVRLPWPCDDPDLIFGVWNVIATVDVACVVVNDTLEFKYDYKVRIFDAYIIDQYDQDNSFKHCEDIIVHIDFGSQAMNTYNITFAITAVDASGVPFGFAYATAIIGGAEWCEYAMGDIELTVHVAKFARPVVGTMYIVALSGLPFDGGSAETPVTELIFGIEAVWA